MYQIEALRVNGVSGERIDTPVIPTRRVGEVKQWRPAIIRVKPICAADIRTREGETLRDKNVRQVLENYE